MKYVDLNGDQLLPRSSRNVGSCISC